VTGAAPAWGRTPRRPTVGQVGSDRRSVERRSVECPDGAVLAAWTVGPVDGQPVVLASGGGADHRVWRSVVPELCVSDAERALWAPHGRSLAARCRVAVFDQRGTGESVQVPPAVSAGVLGEDLVTVSGSLLGSPCCVVGHSMGGMAALHAALDHPDFVNALALVSTTAGGSGLTWPTAAYLERAASGYESGQLQTTDDLELAVSARFRSEYGRLFDAVAEAAASQPRTVGPDDLARVLTNHDVGSRLGEISVPTVVICGTDDQVHPMQNSSFLVGHIPAAGFLPLTGTGHLVNVEAPVPLIDTISGLAGAARAPG
jgi:pimeloyl-ACP methyl ester carboxylesterase